VAAQLATSQEELSSVKSVILAVRVFFFFGFGRLGPRTIMLFVHEFVSDKGGVF
jgi:hypothetical protein